MKGMHSAKAQTSPLAQTEADVPANANAEDEDATVMKKKTRTTMEEQAASGHAVYTQLEVCIYIKMAYIVQFNEADESEWGNIAPTLSSEMGVYAKKESLPFSKMPIARARYRKTKARCWMYPKLSYSQQQRPCSCGTCYQYWWIGATSN
jgi:hypothetical protein